MSLPSTSNLNLIIIALTCIISWQAFKHQAWWQRLVLWPPAISQRHEYWRLVSAGFVHANLQHLLFNMFTLYFFGGWMERFWGLHGSPLAYVLFYLGGLVASMLPSYLRHQNDARYVTLGASGAVSAVLFAFVLMQPWALIFVFVIPVPAIIFAVAFVAYSMYMDRRGRDQVNHSAHLWGAGYGVVVTLLAEPRLGTAFLARLLHPAF